MPRGRSLKAGTVPCGILHGAWKPGRAFQGRRMPADGGSAPLSGIRPKAPPAASRGAPWRFRGMRPSHLANCRPYPFTVEVSLSSAGGTRSPEGCLPRLRKMAHESMEVHYNPQGSRSLGLVVGRRGFGGYPISFDVSRRPCGGPEALNKSGNFGAAASGGYANVDLGHPGRFPPQVSN